MPRTPGYYPRPYLRTGPLSRTVIPCHCPVLEGSCFAQLSSSWDKQDRRSTFHLWKEVTNQTQIRHESVSVLFTNFTIQYNTERFQQKKKLELVI